MVKATNHNMPPDRLRQLYINEGLSIPDIARQLETNFSAVRAALIAAQIPLRSRADGVRNSAPKLSAMKRGKPRTFSSEWKLNIAISRRAHAEKYAAGISTRKDGYTEITRGPHKGRALHIVLVEARIGRHLRRDEVVHHIDGNPRNNQIDNLQVMTRADHTRHHRKERSNGIR